MTVMALVLAIQGYATQTHIHRQDFAVSSIALQAGGEPGHKNLPPDDPARCPICQQIAQAGQFVAPAWLLPFLLILATSKIEIASIAIPHFAAVFYSWRSRGPPLN